MFPNFCFTKAGSDSSYQVVQRNYVPKASNQNVRHGSNRYEVRPTNSYLLRAALRGHDARSTLRDYNGKQVKRLRKTRKTPKKSVPETPPYRQEQKQNTSSRKTRSIEFCLPPTPIDDRRAASVGEKNAAIAGKAPRENAGQATAAEQLHEQLSNTSIDPNRELQESCADFFNIVHDNVLEAVQGAVERMVRKYFQDTVKRMELLAAKLARQELLVTKIHRDLTSKMNEQHESAINQFKFIAQMLIDNQTVHYRSLKSSKKQRKRIRSEDSSVNSQSSITSNKDESRITAGKNEQAAKQQPCKQHQLRQQQDLTNTPQHLCKQCSTRKTSATASTATTTAAAAPTPASSNLKTNLSKLHKCSANSMPNLHSSKSYAAVQTDGMHTVLLPVRIHRPQQKKRTSQTHFQSRTSSKNSTPTRSSTASTKYNYQSHLQRDWERELRPSSLSLKQQRACQRYVRARPSVECLIRANESYV